MPSWRAGLALAAVAALAAGYAFDLDWLVAATTVAILLVAFYAAAGGLVHGQMEWFGREQQRRDRRARRRG